uniref:5'-3' exonuclease alpha-helical arch N-terminal domain-containing protein n=1 Tax=Aegilops tauschii subsp. strangulata TaxID=200361 RepID=A0A453IK83_AEGTS
KECHMAKGMTFRHMLYPAYKSNRTSTPDTIVQGMQYLKASIKAMSIKVIEVKSSSCIFGLKMFLFSFDIWDRQNYQCRFQVSKLMMLLVH